MKYPKPSTLDSQKYVCVVQLSKTVYVEEETLKNKQTMYKGGEFPKLFSLDYSTGTLLQMKQTRKNMS